MAKSLSGGLPDKAADIRNLSSRYEAKISRRGSVTSVASSTAPLRRMSKRRPSYVLKEAVLQTPPSRSTFHAWHPDSKSRLAYNVLSCTMMIYDACVIPFVVAWDIRDSSPLELGLWVTRAFWTLDLPINLILGFRSDDAKLELSLPVTARRYMRSWLIPDLLMVSIDWFSEFGGALDPNLHFVKVVRMVRVCRQGFWSYGLLQKAKLGITSKKIHLAMDVTLLLLIMFWVNHAFCCSWYFIGRFGPSDTGFTWLSDEGYTAAGISYEYFTSLHWALTQMTPGSMEVFPASTIERAFNVATLFFSLLLSSSLVATLTSTMTQYKLQVQGTAEKFMKLQHFLHQQHADEGLAMAIKLQVKSRLHERQQRVKQKDVQYLELASTSLRDALWHSCCIRHMSAHTFLSSLNLYDAAAVKALCVNAAKLQDIGNGDAVFEDGSSGECMYFVSYGQLKYRPGEMAAEFGLPESHQRLTLEPGQWCSEPALWIPWQHLGMLEAVTNSEVLEINALRLQESFERVYDVHSIARDYCKAFCGSIRESPLLSDLPGEVDAHDLMSGLGEETRLALAEPVLQQLRRRTRSNVDLLEEEVADGKCNIGFIGTEPVRTVFVSVLRLRRQPGDCRILVKVGEVLRGSGKVVPYCVMPGIKRWGQLTARGALDHLLVTELAELRRHVEMDLSAPPQQEPFVRDSDKYQIRTRYLRTTFAATLASTPEIVQVPLVPDNMQRPSLRTSGGGFFRGLSKASTPMEVAQAKAASDILEGLSSAMALRCHGKNRAVCKLYVWLNAEDLELFSQEPAQALVHQWVSSLDCSVALARFQSFSGLPQETLDDGKTVSI